MKIKETEINFERELEELKKKHRISTSYLAKKEKEKEEMELKELNERLELEQQEKERKDKEQARLQKEQEERNKKEQEPPRYYSNQNILPKPAQSYPSVANEPGISKKMGILIITSSFLNIFFWLLFFAVIYIYTL